ncbi:amidohydrolase family protein [Streptomyces sp. NPDC002143]
MRIDFHTHIVPPLPDFAERYGDPRWPSFSVDGRIGQLTRDGRIVRTVPPSAWSLAPRIEDMDQAGIDRQVLSPLPPTICDWTEPEAAVQWCLRLNDGIAALVGERPDRFHGLGTVPLLHPDQALHVLESAHAAGLQGVEVGTTAGPHEFDHPELREFFAAAEQLGMIVFIHPLILGARTEWTPRITGPEVTFGLGMGTDTAIAASKLVFGGVTAERPDLRIVLAHGGGTFAWALPRIARLWDETHDRAASDLTANVFVDSVVYAPENLAHLCAALGPDRVLFGTDYPLPAQDDPLGGTLSGLGAAEADKVAGRSAAHLLGIAAAATT